MKSKKHRQPRIIPYSTSGQHEIGLDLQYCDTIRTYSGHDRHFMRAWLDMIPQWNDVIALGDHTYRVTSSRQFFLENGPMRLATCEIIRCVKSPKDELADIQAQILCLDCQIDCVEEDWTYMIDRELWARAVDASGAGMLCIPCLEKRIGRRLTPHDFTEVALNGASNNTLVKNRQGR